MPLVRMTTSVAGVDFEHHAGDEVEMLPDRAQEAVRNGWGELVRDSAPETPEASPARRGQAPETPEGPRTRQVRRRNG